MTSISTPHSKYVKDGYYSSFKNSIGLFPAIIILVIALFPATHHLSIKASGEFFSTNIPVGRISTQNQAQPAITVDNQGNAYIIWGEENTTTLDIAIWIAKSSDGGLSFDFVKRINENADWSQEQPSIALGPDGKVHVVWLDGRPSNPGVYYANSTDGGLIFNPSIKVMDTISPVGFGGSVTRHLIAVDKNNKIHVVWSDNRSGGNNYSIYYANSTDGGISFNPNVRVSDTDGIAFEPSIAIDEMDNIYVAWTDYRNITTRGEDIYFSKSTDGGISFSSDKRINDDLGNVRQMDVTVAANNGLICIVWDDDRDGDRNIYFANSTDGGNNFGINVKVNDNVLGGQDIPSMAINKSGYIGITWMDGRNGNWDIYSANSTDGGSLFSPDQKLNDDIGSEYQYTPHIAIDNNGIVYVVWQDYRSGTIWDIYFTRTNFPPPMTMPVSPPNYSTLSENAPALIATSVTDPDGDTIYYNFTISDQPDAESGTSFSSGWIDTTSWTTPILLDGKWYWHTYTSDVWNTTAPNWVWNFTIDTMPPTISNLQPPDASTTNDNTSIIIANYSDPSGIDLSSVLFKVDGVDETSNASITENGLNFAPILPMADGAHSIYLEVADTVGNSASISWAFMVDSTPPAIANLQPSNGSSVSDSRPIINANFSDASGVNVSSVVLKVDGEDVTALALISADGIEYVPASALSEGSHTVYLEVIDIHGNSANATWTFKVDSKQNRPQDDFLSEYWWILVIIIVVILFPIILFFLWRRRKRKPEDEDDSES